MEKLARALFATAVMSLFLSVLFVIRAPSFADSKGLLAFEAGDTLEEIQEKIAHNGYSFTVDNNWVYDMDPETKGRFFGRRAPLVPRVYSRSDDIGPLANHLQDALPATFDWRDHNGHSYIGSIRDQGNCGSCYAFGACASAEGTYNYAMGIYDASSVDFSEAFVAFCLSDQYSGFDGCDGSTYDYEELDALVDYGVCNENDYLYTDNEQVCPLATHPSTIQFESWHRVPCADIEAIKTAIMTYGVVDAAVHAGPAFQAYSGGVYEDTNSSCDSIPCYYTATNHAIALVGWEDNPPEGGGGCWILRNSWGTGWGEDGYMRIRYDSARVACEVCYLVSASCTPGNPKMTILSPHEGFSSTIGQATTVSVSITDCGPVAGAAVEVSPTNGDPRLNLLDNGVFPDETANDGTYSVNWAPQDAGVVTLSVEASGFGTTLTASVSGDVTEPPVKADFSATPTRAVAPLTVDFTDQSAGDISRWFWVFGDGATSALQNPTHTYIDARAYTVSLTVCGPDGYDTETKEDYVILRRKNAWSWLLLILGD